MQLPLRVTRRLARLLPRRMPRYRGKTPVLGRPKVLLVGVYVADKENTVEHLVDVAARSEQVELVQRWFRMRPGLPPSAAVAAVTASESDDYVPKWDALSRLAGPRPWEEFDYVIFCDDDIWVGDGFIDRLIAHQQEYDLAIAQPARTWRSFTDWAIVRRRFTVRVRETNFVESGPVVSMDKRILPAVMPFSEESPMGWGYDLVWPIAVREEGLKMGIVDAVPVCHSLRGRGELYRSEAEIERMSAFLSSRKHTKTMQTIISHR